MHSLKSVVIFVFILSACRTHESTSTMKDEPSMSTKKEFLFSFSENRNSLGFVGLFRDVPAVQHDEYVRRVDQGLSLGPVPPETQSKLGSSEEESHWYMNAGVYEVADNPGVFGYLLQGVNRSDDMDKYMVREFNKSDGLLPNKSYQVVIEDFSYAANDRVGAFGPGGGETRNFNLYTSTNDPFPRHVDDGIVPHVRFTDATRPNYAAGLGSTGVCILPGSGMTFPSMPMCPNEQRIPYVIQKRPNPTAPTTITTNDQGSFWLLIGGHSGHESLDDYYVVGFKAVLTGEFSPGE